MSDGHVGPMSDSSDDEEATVCPDDQSIDVGMDDLTLGNGGGGGKAAVPTVSPDNFVAEHPKTVISMVEMS